VSAVARRGPWAFAKNEKPLGSSHHPDSKRDERRTRERHGPFERIETEEAGGAHGLSPCFSFVSLCPRLFRHMTG
jgi:hypothetical protein